MLNDSISPGPPSAAKKIHLPCPSPPRNYWVDQQFHPAKVAGSVSLMVPPWSHRSHSSTKSWWGQHNSIYAITTVVGSLGVHFLTDFTAPPWLRQQQWECLTSNFAKSLHPDKWNPPVQLEPWTSQQAGHVCVEVNTCWDFDTKNSMIVFWAKRKSPTVQYSTSLKKQKQMKSLLQHKLRLRYLEFDRPAWFRRIPK